MFILLIIYISVKEELKQFFKVNSKGVLEMTLGEGNGTPLQYSCLENPMDGGAWKAAVHGVAEGQTRLSGFIFTFMHWRRKCRRFH